MTDFQVLLTLMVTIWVFGKIFRALKLPVIFGELLGGVVVGPLVFGLVTPDNEVIKILAELGAFFLMLHAGLETDPQKLFHASKKSLLISLAGIIFPTVGGFFLAKFWGFSFSESLFIGVALSTTAIAISVRLFKDFKILGTSVSDITIGAAVIDDVVALILFSMVLNIVETGSINFMEVCIMLAKILAFFGVVLVGGLKLEKYTDKFFAKRAFTSTLVIALLLGMFSEIIGLHAIVGAFLAGLFIQEEVLDTKKFARLEDRVYGITYGFLGPIFFASLALHLDFSAIFTAPLLLIGIVLVAIFGKIFGAGLAAWYQKIDFKKSVLIGLAMNSRGAVELIIASIGLQKGIIDETIFSILILMAFGTTLFSIFTMKPMAKLVCHKK